MCIHANVYGYVSIIQPLKEMVVRSHKEDEGNFTIQKENKEKNVLQALLFHQQKVK